MATPLFLAQSLTGHWWWPFIVLAVSVGFIIVGISVLRLHAFLALILAALLAGVMAHSLKDVSGGPPIGLDGKAMTSAPLVQAVELTAAGLGRTAGDIAISIGLAAIIGMCLMESGAADKVVRRFLAAFGEKRAGWALLFSTYVLSIPIFFDTMFMLMAPLAKALRLRTGKDYLLYVVCVCCGGVITHSMTVPHPGPIKMVENLKVDVGLSILAGILVGLIPAVLGGLYCHWLNKRLDIPLRETPGTNLAELEQQLDRPESQLPSFLASITPVILPILLISLSSFFKVTADSAKATASWALSLQQTLGGAESFDSIRRFVDFIGHKNIALFIGAGISLFLLAKQRRFGLKKLEQLVGPPLETAGMIILITAAGGAFGLMLRSAGVGDAVKTAAAGKNISLIVLSFIVSAVIRIAQGSATVAMLTTSAIIWPMIDPSLAGATPLEYSRLYLFLSIGFGAMTCSWMNDSGFWVVSRLGGLTEKETLRTWTSMLTVVAITGLLATLLLAKLFPLPQLG